MLGSKLVANYCQENILMHSFYHYIRIPPIRGLSLLLVISGDIRSEYNGNIFLQ
jgi:hypothetical protein